ncbi:hypothetical protein OPS25_10035 [Alteromonas ponticola]|uniref:Uncharacterized protein n=1 Tax=Alteromonas aquimaris TaxID=2998417 RepID=A0ABT3P7T3_9ALTE|nr:hypothetical protein [Alteromonas aquimaris]MCW8108831.1 hypothetical protein [Alteromonas aquimaris]
MLSYIKKQLNRKSADVVIYPRIKNRKYLKELEPIHKQSPDSMPFYKVLTHDLLLTFAIDDGENYLSLSPLLMAKHNISEEQMWDRGLDTGFAAIQNSQVIASEAVWEIRLDEMAACTILYPSFWHGVEQQMGGQVVINFTHKNFVLCARKDNPEHLRTLISIINEIGFGDTHSLSPELYTFVGDEIQRVELRQVNN